MFALFTGESAEFLHEVDDSVHAGARSVHGANPQVHRTGMIADSGFHCTEQPSVSVRLHEFLRLAGNPLKCAVLSPLRSGNFPICALRQQTPTRTRQFWCEVAQSPGPQRSDECCCPFLPPKAPQGTCQVCCVFCCALCRIGLALCRRRCSHTTLIDTPNPLLTWHLRQSTR